MKLIFNEGSFLDIMHQSLFLRMNNYDVVVNNGYVELEDNIDKYIEALELIIKHKISGYSKYKEVLRKAIEEKQRKKVYETLEEEKYDVYENENGYVVATSDNSKYLYFNIIKLENDPFASYSFIAKDKYKDEEYMNFREIPFYIDKNSPLFLPIRNMYKNLNETTINYENEIGRKEIIKGKLIEGERKFSTKYSHIKIEEKDNGYYFIVAKDIWNGTDISNTTVRVDIGSPFTNDKWLLIDGLYNRVQTTYKNIKDKFKSLIKK